MYHGLTTQVNEMKLNADREHGLTVQSDPLTSALQRSLCAASRIEVVNEAEIEIDAEAVTLVGNEDVEKRMGLSKMQKIIKKEDNIKIPVSTAKEGQAGRVSAKGRIKMSD